MTHDPSDMEGMEKSCCELFMKSGCEEQGTRS